MEHLGNAEQLRRLLAASNQGVWAMELDEGCAPRLYGDATMMRLLGIAGRNLLPEQAYCAWFDHIDPNHLEEVERSVAEMIAGARSEVQYPWRHPEQGETWVRCWGIRNASYTQGVRLEGLHRDISELHHVQKRVDRLEQIKAEQERKELLLASVSHDLRTPLNAILGFSELLRNEWDVVRRRVYVDKIMYSGGVLRDLVNDMLDLARLDAGKMVFTPEPVDVWNEVEGVLGMVRGKAEAKGLALTFRIHGLVRVRLDRHRFRQVVFNLLENAIKFTDHGSVQVSVWMDEGSVGTGTLFLKVSDTGVGIRVEDLNRILKPYERVESPQRSCAGSGLGLAICQRIVEHDGGRIEVKSELGTGSTFMVVLPGVEKVEDAAAFEEDPQDGGVVSASAECADLKVLVVDDIETNRMVLVLMCRRLGVKVCKEASNAAQALELMRSMRFDLVFSDKKMPGMDGISLVRAVRADPVLSDVRICLVTADASVDSRYMLTGADGVLVKPISMERLAKQFGLCSRGRCHMAV